MLPDAELPELVDNTSTIDRLRDAAARNLDQGPSAAGYVLLPRQAESAVPR